MLTLQIAGDGFCSLWLTKPEEDGYGDTCLRVIPADNLISPGTRDRFRSNLEFWMSLEPTTTVDLYDCGHEDGRYFMLMRYMPKGSAADQLKDTSWTSEALTTFAVDLASSLRNLHSSVGPHGNLKPSNIFPTLDRGVLLSDYMLPLWLDELESGSQKLVPRILHPYRAPEQHSDPRDYDTRSDVFTFGMVMLWCLSGEVPSPEDAESAAKEANWPPGMAKIVRRCLRKNPDKRFADAMELFEALCASTGRTPLPSEARQSEKTGTQPEPSAPQVPPPSPSVTADRLEEAEIFIGKGRLDDAVAILETLPPGTPGMADLLDEVERRQEASERLADEAVRLAGMGKIEAAADSLRQAETLWIDCETVQAVKSELSVAADEDSAFRTGKVPFTLRDALDARRYAEARPLVERLLEEEYLSDEARRTIEEFKLGRARKGLLDSVKAARKMVVAGQMDRARHHWLEAAKWIPSGPERDKLLRFAEATARGKLRVGDVPDEKTIADAAPSPQPTGPDLELPPELQAKLDDLTAEERVEEEKRRNLRLLVILGVVSVLIGMALALILGYAFF